MSEGFTSGVSKVINSLVTLASVSASFVTKALSINVNSYCAPKAPRSSCEYAQKAAENIANAGLKAIWNFTNTTLNLPPDIVQQRVNMAGDLAELSVKLSGKLWND